VQYITSTCFGLEPRLIRSCAFLLQQHVMHSQANITIRGDGDDDDGGGGGNCDGRPVVGRS